MKQKRKNIQLRYILNIKSINIQQFFPILNIIPNNSNLFVKIIPIGIKDF